MPSMAMRTRAFHPMSAFFTRGLPVALLGALVLGCRPGNTVVVTPVPAGDRGVPGVPASGAPPSGSPVAQADCQFLFGFQDMKNLAGADRVGDCTEEER